MTKIDSTPKINTAGPEENAPDQLVRLGLYVVIVGAIIGSGSTLVFLAEQAGWTGWTAYLLPVLIDLPGFLGGRIWLRRKPTNPQTRGYARRLTLAALGASLAGNVTGHLIHAGHLPAGLALVIVAAMVAPIVLAAVLHLDALLTPTSRRLTRRTDKAAPAPAALEPTTPARPELEPSARPATRPPATSRPASSRPAAKRAEMATPAAGRKGTKKARARVLWDAARAEGRMPTAAELARAVEADDSGARGWVREWKDAEPGDRDQDAQRDEQDQDAAGEAVRIEREAA
ncbi:DUF2637 domain-containing protein [Microlunatus speluncae]|uniref:DUF2637 domain-containing protein n=1 Tax=Microlunatus speluncae TaxID=2594267 RepID=UPI0012666CFF|nr:DUF2637 domain-containing protein [Microlunatus speluncae]